MFRCAKRFILLDSTDSLENKLASESTVKISQHKVTKYLLLYSFENFTTGNPTQTPFFFFVKNPVYVNLLVGIVNYYLLFPSGSKVFGKILIQKRRLNFMTLCYGILTIGTSSSFSRSSCFTGQNEVFSTTE